MNAQAQGELFSVLSICSARVRWAAATKATGPPFYSHIHDPGHSYISSWYIYRRNIALSRPSFSSPSRRASERYDPIVRSRSPYGTYFPPFFFTTSPSPSPPPSSSPRNDFGKAFAGNSRRTSDLVSVVYSSLNFIFVFLPALSKPGSQYC